MPFGLTALEFSDYVILGVGVATILLTAGMVTARRRWDVYRRLPAPLEHSFTPADLLLGLLAFWFLPGVLWRIFIAVGGGNSPVTRPATAPAVEALSSLPELLAQVVGFPMVGIILVFLARQHVCGGLAGWGLQVGTIRRDLLLAVAAFIAVWPVVLGLLGGTRLLITLFDPSYMSQDHAALQTLRAVEVSAWAKGLTVFVALVLAPVVEELFCRGVVQTALAGWCGDQWAAVLLTGGIFGLLHWAVPDTVPAMIFFGIALGYVYARTRSLTLAILIHVVFNAKNVAFALLAPGSP